MRWQKAESCSCCPTAKCCLDPDSNQGCCGRIVVSSIHCGCSNPGSDPGQGSILLSGKHDSAFCHLILQLDFVSEAHWSPVLPSCSQDSWPAADRSTRAKPWEVPTCNLFHAQAVLAAGRQHRTSVSFRHKIQLKNEVAKFREMFLNARHQKAALTQLRTWVVAATMHRTNHYTTTANHWLTAANRAYGVLVRCREGAKKLARDE